MKPTKHAGTPNRYDLFERIVCALLSNERVYPTTTDTALMSKALHLVKEMDSFKAMDLTKKCLGGES